MRLRVDRVVDVRADVRKFVIGVLAGFAWLKTVKAQQVVNEREPVTIAAAFAM